MASILIQTPGDVRSQLYDAITDVAANHGSTAMQSVVTMLDAMLDLYAVEMMGAVPDRLPEFQLAARQVMAIRNALALPGEKNPTIF